MALLRREVVLAFIATFLSGALLIEWPTSLRSALYGFITGCLLMAIIIIIVTISSSRRTTSSAAQLYLLPAAAFINPRVWDKEVSWFVQKKAYYQKQLLPSEQVSRGLDELLEQLVRHFVLSWYSDIVPSPDFSNQVDYLLRTALLSVVDRIQSRDIIEEVVLKLLPIVIAHLREFSEAEHAVRGKRLNRNVTESEELDLAIAAKYKDGKLHPAASLSFSDTMIVQQEYLRKVILKLMPLIMPDEVIQSRSVSVLIKEIASCAVLSPIMRLFSDPDFWNQTVEAYGKTMLQDRKTVRKMRAALDEHTSPAAKSLRPHTFPRLLSHDDERKFEKFIRAIRRCNNLSEARRFRNEVSSQLKRESMVEGQDLSYLRKLETGKRILDQRVNVLSTVSSPLSMKDGVAKTHSPQSPSVVNASLKEILRDASGLSYFMEYMDRQDLLTLVQFWLVVEGIRNPLEDDATEDSQSAQEPVEWTKSDREDIAQISDVYMSKAELQIPPDARDLVKEFLNANDSATLIQYNRARRSILRAQNVILEIMHEKHFPGFRQSDLFYKLLTSDDTSTRQYERQIQTFGKEDIAQSLDKHVSSRADFFTNTGNRYKTSSSQIHQNTSSLTAYSTLADSISVGGIQSIRHSLNGQDTKPLFEDDLGPDLVPVVSLGGRVEADSGEDRSRNQDMMVKAMEAALDNIISSPEDESNEALAGVQGHEFLTKRTEPIGDDGVSRKSVESPPADWVVSRARERPNLASLGLVNTSSRIGVFTDNDLFGDETMFPEDEHADPEEESDTANNEEIHEAEPGDLGLAEAVSALTVDIDRLTAQESIVDTLTRKAELTNNVAELRILGKSKSSLQRELRRKELQRQQYIVQESDNSLFGRAHVSIKSIMVGKDDDGQEFALYVIEVQRKAGEHIPAASWVVARRYSEFHDLHQRLRHVYPAVRQLEFPRRRLVMKLQRDFLQKRRFSLENYLRELLLLPAVCRSRDLRAFLSQRPILSNRKVDHSDNREDIVSRIYNSVTDGMDEFLGNLPVLDQLSVAGQNLISAATTQYYGSGTTPISENANQEEAVAAREGLAELEVFENQSLEPFVKPVCDLFLEIFELNRSQNWLRGRAVVVVLQQLLGGTVERKIRETIRSFFSDASILNYISTVRQKLWPGDERSRGSKPRSLNEKNASRRGASLVLATLVPDLAGGVVGKANAHAAGRRIFATLNNERLNSHLAFTLLDEIIAILFVDDCVTAAT